MKYPAFVPSMLSLCALLAPALASAQTAQTAPPTEEEISLRREALERATQAAAQGDHARALELALGGGRIQMSPSLRQFIAQQHSILGQHAAALLAAQLCAREADRDAAVANRTEIRTQCIALANASRLRVGAVTVRVGAAPPPGLRVRVRGSELRASLFGLPYVVDPGNVLVEAEAPGREPLRRTVYVEAGDVLDVEVLLAAADAPGRVQVPATGAPPALPAAPGEPRARSAPARSIGPWVLVGAGGAAVVASLGLWAGRAVLIGNCVIREEAGVLVGDCPTRASAARADGAYPVEIAAWTTLGLGVATVAAGALWRALEPPAHRRPRRVDGTAQLQWAPAYGGLTAYGAF